MFNLIISFVIY